ncbi:hypothetical protein, partial [Asanoa sp. NPDC050611]|uniref:hypothetical protein n=1 Tax=Asanoa sp. NPDC050611 TaxID=3157098 RepID=UPI00340A27C4
MNLLRGNGDFRRLYAATTIDKFGSWLLVFAAPLHVYALAGVGRLDEPLPELAGVGGGQGMVDIGRELD